MIFLTGATGFLGRQLLTLLSQGSEPVYALVRPQSKRKLGELATLPNVTWIEGDIESPGVVLRDEDRERLERDVTRVIHGAALYDMEATHEALYTANVVGTHHLVHLSSTLPRLSAFHHVSTMAVAGNYAGNFTESMFHEGQTFPDHYAATKFAAENCVRQWETAVPRFIHRLAILVGDSRDGSIPKVDGPYYLMRALQESARVRDIANRLHLLPLPFDENARAYLVPVDAAAAAIATIVRGASGLTPRQLRVYHVMGEDGGLPIRVVLRKILEESGIQAKVLAIPSNAAVPWVAKRIGVPAPTLHYLYSPCRFEMRRLAKDFPDFVFPRFEQYGSTVFRYARERLLAQPKGARAS